MRPQSIAVRAALVCAAGGLAFAAWSAVDSAAAHAADRKPSAEQPAGLLGHVARLPDKAVAPVREIVDQVVPEPERDEPTDEPTPPPADEPEKPRADEPASEPAPGPQESAPAQQPATPEPAGGVLDPVVDAVDEVLTPVTEAIPPAVEPILDTTAPITDPVLEVVQPVTGPVVQKVTQILPAAEPIAAVTKPHRPKPAPATPPAVATPAPAPAAPAAPILGPIAAPAAAPRPVDDRIESERPRPACDDAEPSAETPADIDRPAPRKAATLAPSAPAKPCPAPGVPGDLCQAVPAGTPTGQQHHDQVAAMLAAGPGTPILQLLRALWPRADVAPSRAEDPEPGPA